MALETFGELLALKYEEFQQRLSEGDYGDLQRLCKHVGLNAKGSRGELENRLLEYKRGLQDEEPKSPDRNGGRARSPKPGKAAAALRAVAPKAAASASGPAGAMDEDPRLMSAAEFQAKGPQSWPAPPPQTVPIHTPGPLNELSPEIVLAKQRVQAMRAELAPVPPLPSGEAAQPSNADLMAKLERMAGAMALKEDVQVAQLEVVKQLRTEFKSELEPLRAQVGQAELHANQARNETKTLHERLTKQEQGNVMEFDRVGRLETEMQALKVQMGSRSVSRPDKNDIAHLRVSFKGFTTESIGDREETIKAFMEQHFNGDYSCISTRMRGPHDKRTASDESFVQFACPEERDRVVGIIQAKKLGNNVKSSQGAKLTVGKMKTDWVRQRDFAMRKSEELIKEKLQEQGAQSIVKYEKAKESRKIMVDGAEAFVQRAADPLGCFVGRFSELKIP